ncbi:PepSY domain-containing protein [Clostridium sp. B9]|uniref:PepSY domain-containing protein n=1 Tax=Clostridium sp. B9 TaxID=3423224 RepID=UPI003D2F5047
MKKKVIGLLIIGISIIFISCNNQSKNSNINNQVSSNQKENVSSQNIQGKVYNNQSKITLDQAKEIALKHADILENQITFIKGNREFDDGIDKYEIEFYFDNKEYDYDINANTGEIISYDYDIKNYNNKQSKITVEKAKEIALKHANLSGNQVTFIKVDQEFDDGIDKYDIQFYFDNKEYEYDINADTGEIVSFDYE